MINKVTLIGFLGKDVEVKHFENEKSVANFTLATNETYVVKETGEKKEETEWHNVVAWNGLARIAEKFLKKGSQVYIEGKLTTRSYEDKDGVTRYTTEVVARTLKMLGKKESSSYSMPTVADAPQN